MVLLLDNGDGVLPAAGRSLVERLGARPSLEKLAPHVLVVVATRSFDFSPAGGFPDVHVRRLGAMQQVEIEDWLRALGVRLGRGDVERLQAALARGLPLDQLPVLARALSIAGAGETDEAG